MELMIRMIAAGDRKVMHRVNRWTPPLWVRRWMVFASRAGDGGGWILFGLCILAWGGNRRFAALEAALIAVCVGQALFNVVKRVTGRVRPCATEAHCWATLLPPDRFSFPSGHTITAFSVAVPLGMFYPALLVPLIFCAMSVASSRVLLGLHFLSDVLAGIAIGCALGVAAVQLVT
jgi:undecaprenyl-diphosphatase